MTIFEDDDQRVLIGRNGSRDKTERNQGSANPDESHTRLLHF
jgi:hypothetical protein